MRVFQGETEHSAGDNVGQDYILVFDWIMPSENMLNYDIILILFCTWPWVCFKGGKGLELDISAHFFSH